MNKFHRSTMLFVLLVASIMMSGCYGVFAYVSIPSGQVIIEMEDGVSITSVGGAGLYSNSAYRASYEVYDATVHTFQWEDASLPASNNQEIGIKLSVSVRRPNETEPDMVKNAWRYYQREMREDIALESLISSKLGEGVKNTTASSTLSQMLGTNGSDVGRDELKKRMMDNIAPTIESMGFVLVDISISDISPSPEYRKAMERIIEAENKTKLAQEEVKQSASQLDAEKKRTEVELEIANRNRLTAEEQSKVYRMSPEAFELAKIEAYGKALGDNSKIFFVQPGQDVTMFLNPDMTSTTSALTSTIAASETSMLTTTIGASQ